MVFFWSFQFLQVCFLFDYVSTVMSTSDVQCMKDEALKKELSLACHLLSLLQLYGLENRRISFSSMFLNMYASCYLSSVLLLGCFFSL